MCSQLGASIDATCARWQTDIIDAAEELAVAHLVLAVAIDDLSELGIFDDRQDVVEDLGLTAVLGVGDLVEDEGAAARGREELAHESTGGELLEVHRRRDPFRTNDCSGFVVI